MLSDVLGSILEEIRGLEWSVAGPLVVAAIFLALAARARASALADFKTYDKIWVPVSANLKESPSPSDALSVGIRALFRGVFRSVLTVIFGFLAADFLLVGGRLTLNLLVWLGL